MLNNVDIVEVMMIILDIQKNNKSFDEGAYSHNYSELRICQFWIKEVSDEQSFGILLIKLHTKTCEI